MCQLSCVFSPFCTFGWIYLTSIPLVPEVTKCATKSLRHTWENKIFFSHCTFWIHFSANVLVFFNYPIALSHYQCQVAKLSWYWIVLQQSKQEFSPRKISNGLKFKSTAVNNSWFETILLCESSFNFQFCLSLQLLWTSHIILQSISDTNQITCAFVWIPDVFQMSVMKVLADVSCL